MSIETEIQDLRPILAPNLYVTLSGPIEDGDADRLRDVLSRYDSHNLREIFVFLDSPGGSLYEGLRIAGVLGSRSEIVISQVGTDENPNAECASACVLAFIGAICGTSLRMGGLVSTSSPIPERGLIRERG